MKNFRSHFVFNRSQQNGIFILVAVIILLQLIYFFYPLSSEVEEDPEHEKMVLQLQKEIDSLKQVRSQEISIPLKPFNPNFISDYKGYMLGMSLEEIDRLHEYRAQELWVNSAEEFQEVTGVSDSLLKILSPYFKFSDFSKNRSQENKVSKKAFSTPLPKTDLNAATAEELQKVNGIGEKLSARIVNYRNSLGGFRGNAQLKDVYELSPEVVERVLERFEVKSSAVEKIDINAATVMQLSEIPYLKYEQARAIVKYREEVGRIESFNELLQIKDFPVDKLDRFNLYLTIDREK